MAALEERGGAQGRRAGASHGCGGVLGGHPARGRDDGGPPRRRRRPPPATVAASSPAGGGVRGPGVARVVDGGLRAAVLALLPLLLEEGAERSGGGAGPRRGGGRRGRGGSGGPAAIAGAGVAARALSFGAGRSGGARGRVRRRQRRRRERRRPPRAPGIDERRGPCGRVGRVRGREPDQRLQPKLLLPLSAAAPRGRQVPGRRLEVPTVGRDDRDRVHPPLRRLLEDDVAPAEVEASERGADRGVVGVAPVGEEARRGGGGLGGGGGGGGGRGRETFACPAAAPSDDDPRGHRDVPGLPLGGEQPRPGPVLVEEPGLDRRSVPGGEDLRSWRGGGARKVKKEVERERESPSYVGQKSEGWRVVVTAVVVVVFSLVARWSCAVRCRLFFDLLCFFKRRGHR